MSEGLSAPPVLSTPAEHLFELAESVTGQDTGQVQHVTDEEIREVYEVARTARELRDGNRGRIALQFPDHMLKDAPAVVALLRKELELLQTGPSPPHEDAHEDPSPAPTAYRREAKAPSHAPAASPVAPAAQPERIYILADTSYSACCVDEIAAEHIDADVVVHYGRSCLSPTSRLPVIYVFTKHRLDHADVLEAFEKEFPDRDSKVVLVADVTYQDHLPALHSAIGDRGYKGVLSTSVIRRPMGELPNRAIVDSKGGNVDCEGESKTGRTNLAEYDVFHISTPPTSLLLALSTRVKSLRVFPTAISAVEPSPYDISDAASAAQTARRLLGRRYAKVLTLATAGVIGILVNTLSVTNYLSSIETIKRRIAAAGKKSYTVVVGKLNPAKLANFAEIDGWVVVGCWESSLVEDDSSFYRPAVTPFELEVALMSDEERVWGGSWWGGIENLREGQEAPAQNEPGSQSPGNEPAAEGADEAGDEESEAPEFDLRTGKLVSRSRPMRASTQRATAPGVSSDQTQSRPNQSGALALRPKAEVATVNGVVSPGAEFLRSQRTWTGLGSDFDHDERSTTVQEGRSGIARGYTGGGAMDRP